MLFRSCTLWALLSTLISTAPLHAEREAREAELQERQLTYSTPGINWAYVTQECNPTQQSILRSAAISTQDFLGYADYGYERSWAWSQYWLDVNPNGPGKNGGWKHDAENVALYGNIRNSIKAARLWATTGHKSGRTTELKQISYRCAEENLNKCTNDLVRGVGAYTSHPQRTGKGWQITFCPAFFAKQTAKDIVAKGRTTSINALISVEHLMAHEYMHVGMLGHCEAIIDVNTTLLPSSDGAYAQVYGASRCKEWAWLNVPNGDPGPQDWRTKASINREVVLNADNYAWYATSEYFSYLWSKNTAKRDDSPYVGPPIDGESALFDDSTQPNYATFTIDPETGDAVNQGITYDDENDNGDADVIVEAGANPNLAWPQNCHAPNSTDPDGQVLCDYVGEQYTDHTASISPVGPAPTDLPNINASSSAAPPTTTGTTCNCNENGCSADSPACCANGSCTTQTIPPAAPSPTAATPPYSTGICSFHLTETQDCESVGKNLYAIINLKDGAGNDIGDTSVSPTTDPIGDGINDGGSYTFNSKLPNSLVVTGEHQNDYIQFQYGGLSWQSRTPNGGGHCNVGGWDPRDGPICGQRSRNLALSTINGSTSFANESEHLLDGINLYDDDDGGSSSTPVEKTQLQYRRERYLW